MSHRADHNPDHRALHLFTRVALWDLGDEISPRIYPYLAHYPRWPRPRGYHTDLEQAPPVQLRDKLPWEQLVLSEDEVARKYAAVRSHRTQFGYASAYLSAFVRRNELFGEFAPISLTARGAENEAAASGSFLPCAPFELLNAEEKARFVGIESWQVGAKDDDLLCRVYFSRPLAAAVAASVNIFGYRRDRNFAEMPRVVIHVDALGYPVFDQGHIVQMEGVSVARETRHIVVSLPFRAIGDPDRILISARTSIGEIPLDWIPWRVLHR